MKILLSFLIFIITACNNSIYGDSSAMNTLNNYVTLTINSKEYKLILYDNDTARDFLRMLPLTITMNDLNSNEKYHNLNTTLTTKSERVGSIKRGDFMLYGNNCLVLFYESFSTSYSYTKIGYIENTDGLKDSLGRGSIEITFSAN
ncbi:cyclophilin-like fold protein [Brachyspira pilosicoli]|uniref:cyclophilin-like fold protein n=1 Tax=Brachyspira pilosicoli TaxID=52584 RepID=UPI0025433DF9|nr:cyclophilin-like fold protein [Brachyspira pilosicoli]WIH81348.1 cyclophilin-like fold protein [Brachyspira pilosicoli]WIH88045.1 cyclophilin-like fold protein [Brachyspira pilosicoli]